MDAFRSLIPDSLESRLQEGIAHAMTLGADGADINFIFDPALRDFYCEQAPDAFAPVAGGWGRMGATRCDLKRVDEATFLSALTAAHRRAMARAGKKPRRG